MPALSFESKKARPATAFNRVSSGEQYTTPDRRHTMHDPADTPSVRYLDPRQAAAYIGVTVRGLEAWRNKGGGPEFLRIGARLVRYDVRKIDEWMASHRRASTSDPSRPEAA
jgi:predicted DNA-binding transcriptional regulator AlpA